MHVSIGVASGVFLITRIAYRKDHHFQPWGNVNISDQQREEVDDAGYAICEECATSYMPAPGFINDGHQCDDDGTKPEYVIADY